MTVTAETVAARLDTIRQRIASTGRAPATIRIIAVTKSFDADVVRAAVGAGLRDLGENYAQELLAKASAAPDVRWHFLGAIQRRKVAGLAPVVHLWHGVDRVVAGEEIARRSPGASVLVEVNVSGRPNRPGAAEAETPALVESLQRLDLDVAGLMVVASAPDSDTAAREFERVARLRDQLGLRELSMGMTDDFEFAVAAGSTMIRIGRALFGARPQPSDARR